MKYFAFVTTGDPSIQPLENAATFDEASDIVEGMLKQGEIVPWIFDRQDLERIGGQITEALAERATL